MIKGHNQIKARSSNLKSILQIIRNGKVSCSDIAEQINISKPAITMITTELVKLNLIKTNDVNMHANSGLLGRKRVYFEVNADLGVVAAIDFSSVTTKIVLSDMVGKIVATDTLADCEVITDKNLENIAAKLQAMLSNGKYNNLLAICIGASGKVNKYTHKVTESYKLSFCETNIVEYFSNCFSCAVEVENDINLSLLGEKSFGNLKNNNNDAVYMYIDSGVGGGIYANNKIIEGNNGYAGEFGSIITTDEDGQRRPFDVVCSINSLKIRIRQRLAEGLKSSLPDNFHFADVVTAYLCGDKVVCEVIEQNAKIVSSLLYNFAVIFDCGNIIIGGRVCALGDRYLNILKQSLKDYAPPIEIGFAAHNGMGVIMGAISTAIDCAADGIVNKRS